jgi:hypothetical protein
VCAFVRRWFGHTHGSTSATLSPRPPHPQYLDGPEVDCDLVMSDGVPVYGAVTDNWPTVGARHSRGGGRSAGARRSRGARRGAGRGKALARVAAARDGARWWRPPPLGMKGAEELSHPNKT